MSSRETVERNMRILLERLTERDTEIARLKDRLRQQELVIEAGGTFTASFSTVYEAEHLAQAAREVGATYSWSHKTKGD